MTARLAAQVTARAAERCAYYHAPQILMGQAFPIDHITPRSVGGQTTAENLCLACSHCNIAKGDRTEAIDPRTGKRAPFYHPRTQVWEKHFRWNWDWKKVLGETPSGRATVVGLAMNAQLLQQARPFWRVAGVIP